MVEPIKPDDVIAAKRNALPDAVIQIFNKLIADDWDGDSSTVIQKEAATLIAFELNTSPAEVYSQGYLEIESVFREAGWCVDHDKPGFNESYPAAFRFTKG